MPSEPSTKWAVAFVDGQNLYHSVREAFGYTYPNYDVSALPAFPILPMTPSGMRSG